MLRIKIGEAEEAVRFTFRDEQEDHLVTRFTRILPDEGRIRVRFSRRAVSPMGSRFRGLDIHAEG